MSIDIDKRGSQDALEAFDAARGGRWRVDELLKYISLDGLTIFDINTRRTRRYTLAQLRRDLSSKSSDVKTKFIHLGYIYANPYPQYSTLSYEPQANGLIVKMSGWYRLTFRREGDTLKLAKLEYLTLEGD